MKIKHVLMTLALAAATLTATGQTVTTDAGQTYAPANLGANTLANATTLTISGEWTASQVDSRLRAAIAGTTSGSNAVLTTVTFEPDAVMESMKYLFRNCTALTGVMMPTAENSAAVDFLQAFDGCKALAGTVNLNAFTAISNMMSAFEGCILLEGVTMPATNTAPDAGVNFFNAFSGCTALQSVNLNGFTAISSMQSAFKGCTALEGVTLPDANTAPSGGVNFTSAFRNCAALTGTVDVSGFTNISYMNYAFYGCTGITGVKFSATENSAAVRFNSAFYGCTALQSVDLSKFTAISTMGSAFSGCTSLTSVKLGGALPATTIGAFDNTNFNCLVYVPVGWGAKPSDWNIIYIAGGTTVEDVTLQPDKPFHCPEAFTIGTGNRIRYYRNFGTEPSGIKGAAAGWETICLPFTPTEVTGTNKNYQGITLVPFNAEGTYAGKGTEGVVPFWLRALMPDSYTPVTTIEPDKPYIIAMPNNPAYDNKYNVADEPVYFSATATADAPVTIGVTPEVLPSVTGASYTLHGNYSTVPAAQSMYVINTEGTAFVANGGEARPFRPYVTANNPMGAPAQFVIGKDEGGATAIEEAVLMGYSGGASADGLRVYGSNERGALVVEAVAASASTVDVVAIDGRTVRTVSLQEGVNVVNGLAAGVYVVGGQKAVVR